MAMIMMMMVVFLLLSLAVVIEARGKPKIEPPSVMNTKIHKCKDAGEAYGAAYLITKEHLIYQPTDANLTWVNCEMGSFIMMNGRASPQKNINGSIVQTLDIFDFSMVHLSWFERLQGRYKLRKSDPIKIVNATTDILRMKALLSHEHALPPASPDLNRTIVIMPWLGSEHGAGHSKISNRLAYLRSCFWSLYEEYPNIAVMVKNEKDQQILRNFTEMPFYDVVWIPNLPKSASLPVATVQQAKVRLMDGRWDFDFVFFTESDQLLMIRQHEMLYSYLHNYPRHVFVPHRLVPYPEEVLTDVHKRNLSTSQIMDWTDMNCCLPLQNCLERKSWIRITNASVPVVNIFGLQVGLGNLNFHEESFRACELTVDGNALRPCHGTYFR